MRIAKTQLIFLVLFIIHYASGNLITADFSQGTDGWNHGQGLWTIQTNANGLASNESLSIHESYRNCAKTRHNRME